MPMDSLRCGVTVAEAAENLVRVFANSAGTCTVSEFKADPDRYLTEWVGGTAAMYVASRSR